MLIRSAFITGDWSAASALIIENRADLQSWRFGMSALGELTDIPQCNRHVRFTPKADSVRCARFMSALCHNRTSRHSLDHLVSNRKHSGAIRNHRHARC